MKAETSSSLKILLISSFNLSNLGALLSKDQESPPMCAISAPFGQAMQTLLQRSSEVWSERVSGAVIWTSPESVSLSYKRLLESEEVGPEELAKEVDEFCGAIKAIPSQVNYIFVPSWIMAPYEARLGLLDMDAQRGLSLALLRMNLRLAESLQDDPRVFVLDASRWVAVHGQKSFSPRMWYMSKTPYSVELFREAAVEIRAAMRALMGQTKKLIVLDLDDCLWGGIVGDAGWQGLRLGGHDPIGEAFRDFQFMLKALKQRGVLLGIVSKNEESVALEAIRAHPEMVLRQDDFAGWRINWRDKAQNIADLASELNLGMQSLVFVDNSPVERARVLEALPVVFVPEWPENPMEYKTALAQLRCFDAPRISPEDRVRTEMYVSERKRRYVRTHVTSYDQWLDSLNIRVAAEPLNKVTLDRATQLLNKTNQMNLSTRRLSREEFWNWSQKPGNIVLVVRVSDKFGDYGLVGIASLSLSSGRSEEALLVDFVLSCRVMGRKVEETMLHALVATARAAGVRGLLAQYIPTPKNLPCLRFLESAGLLRNGEGSPFILDLTESYPKPETIRLAIAPGMEPLWQVTV